LEYSTSEAADSRRGAPAIAAFLSALLAALVWTGGGVDAAFRQAEALDRPPVDQVLADDLLDIADGYRPVPDLLGVDDHRGPVLALIEAAGFVGAHARLEPRPAHFFLKRLVQRLSLSTARAAWRARIALIDADKDVPLEIRQKCSPVGDAFILSDWRQRGRDA
jgi:hypothetical protein